LKLTFHKSGKLGFSKLCNATLSLQKNKYAKFGKNEIGEMYLYLTNDNEEDTFKIARAGEYYYINIKRNLEDFGINETDSLTFDIGNFEEKFFKLTRRDFKTIRN